MRSVGQEVPVRVQMVSRIPLGVMPKWEPVEAFGVGVGVGLVGGVGVGLVFGEEDMRNEEE